MGHKVGVDGVIVQVPGRQKEAYPLEYRMSSLFAKSLWCFSGAILFTEPDSIFSVIDNEWGKIPHFYSDFYGDQDATGILTVSICSRQPSASLRSLIRETSFTAAITWLYREYLQEKPEKLTPFL